MRKEKSLRFFVTFWFIIASLIPLLILGAVSHFFIKWQLEKSIDKQSRILARLVAQDLSKLFSTQEQLLAIVKNDLESGVIPESRFQEYVSSFKLDETVFESIVLLDNNGEVKFISPFRKEFIGIDFSNYDFFKKVKESGKSQWSDTFISPFSGNSSIALGVWSKPVIIVGIIDLNKLSERMSKFEAEKDVYIIVTDSRGVIIAAHEKDIVAQRMSVKNLPMIAEALKGNCGVFEYKSNGIEYIGCAENIPEIGWLSVVIQPEDVALASLFRFNVFFFAFLGGTILIIIIVSLVAPRNLLRLIQDLKLQIANIASGKYEPVEKSVKFKAREFNELLDDVTNMANAIRDREQSIEEAKRDWEMTFDSVPDMIFLLKEDGTIFRANTAAADFLGCSIQELIGKKCYEVVHGTAEHPPNCPHMLSQRTGQVESAEMELSDGKYVQVTCSPIRGRDGEILGTVHVARDVTDRKKLESEIIRSKNLLENLFENSTEAIGVVDRHGRFMKINRRTEEIFGYSRHELIGQKFDTLYADKKELEELLSILRTKKIVREKEVRMIVKSGELVPMETSISLLYDANGELLGSVAHARDLREKKSLEAQLLQAQKMEAIGILAGGIAHDFNNLLTTIKGYSQILLMDEQLRATEGEALQEIERAASRAGELVSHLLTFSRRVERTTKLLNLNEVVVNVKKLLKRSLPKNIELDIQLSPDLSPIKTDSVQMEQIILNLAINAKDAMPEGGHLEIRTENVVLSEEEVRRFIDVQPGRYVLLSIRDTGCGIPEEMLGSIFDPFFTTKEVGKGTGLGLSIVYGIVKSHKGFIDVETKVGEGTNFKIYFPAEFETDELSLSLEKEAKLQGGKEKIMIVDDEEGVARVAVEILSRFGYDVVWAASGEEAVELFEKTNKRFDLIILDYMMPKMDGLACMKKIRSIDEAVKILFATGFVSDIPFDELYQHGANGVIQKPFDVDDLLAAVRRTLDE